MGPREVNLMAMAMRTQSGNVTTMPISATTTLSSRRGPSSGGAAASPASRRSWRFPRRGVGALPGLDSSIGIVIRVAPPRVHSSSEDLDQQENRRADRAERTHHAEEAYAAGTLARIQHHLVSRAEVELIQRQALLHRFAKGFGRPDHRPATPDEGLVGIRVSRRTARAHERGGGDL